MEPHSLVRPGGIEPADGRVPDDELLVPLRIGEQREDGLDGGSGGGDGVRHQQAVPSGDAPQTPLPGADVV